MKARPTVLLAEPEPTQALSVRKLVLETAKFNVVTAHSGDETLELLDRFPNVDAVVLHSQIDDIDHEKLFAVVKKLDPQKPTIFLSAAFSHACRGADHIISSHEPEELLILVRTLFGDPRPSSLASSNT